MSEPEDPTRIVDRPASDPLRALVERAREDVGAEAEVAALAARLAPVIGPRAAGGPGAGASAGTAGAGSAPWIGAAIVGAAVIWLATQRTSPVPHDEPRGAAAARTPTTAPPAPPVLESAGAAASGQEARAAPLPPSAAPDRKADLGGSAGSPLEHGGSGTGQHETGPAAPPSRPSEADLLGHAQSRLASDPNAALDLTEAHRRLFPHGLLVQEREVVAIEALHRLGRRSEATARGAAFLKAFPASAHRSKVVDIVGSR